MICVGLLVSADGANSVDLSHHSVSSGGSRQFIYETADFPSAHASTIVELLNGQLMAAWFGGTQEGHPDVAIWGAILSDGKWSVPVELSREPGTPSWNPVLFYSKDKRLWLYYKFGTNPTMWTGARRVSEDHGKSWSRPEHLPAGLYGPIRSKPLLLKSGVIVSGTSVESYRNWAAWIERSTDDGKTWAKSGPITIPSDLYGETLQSNVPKEVPGSSDWAYTEGIIQPSVVSLSQRHLRLYARSTAKMGKICIADSFDAGKSWSQARPINLPNPNSGLDAVTLRDGRIVLAYNHTNSGRTPLNLAVSSDGEQFKMFSVLEDGPGEFSYPAIIQGKNGDLHLTYTWNRKRICYLNVKLGNIPKK